MKKSQSNLKRSNAEALANTVAGLYDALRKAAKKRSFRGC